jgi:hypothetical protein
MWQHLMKRTLVSANQVLNFEKEKDERQGGGNVLIIGSMD